MTMRSINGLMGYEKYEYIYCSNIVFEIIEQNRKKIGPIMLSFLMVSIL